MRGRGDTDKCKPRERVSAVCVFMCLCVHGNDGTCFVFCVCVRVYVLAVRGCCHVSVVCMKNTGMLSRIEAC